MTKSRDSLAVSWLLLLACCFIHGCGTGRVDSPCASADASELGCSPADAKSPDDIVDTPSSFQADDHTPPEQTPPPGPPSPIDDPPPDEVAPPDDPQQVDHVLVVVGVGTGGTRVASNDGFTSDVHTGYDVGQSLTNASSPNCVDPEATIINGRCCYDDALECYGPGGHSDFLYRGAAFGNGRFVAVGGWGHGITRVSLDGINWHSKQNLHASLTALQGGVRSGVNWIADVTYGLGRFVAVSGGGGGFLLDSTDGQSWRSVSGDGTPNANASFRKIISTDNGFLAVADSGYWAYSSNGIDWDYDGRAATTDDAVNGRIHTLAYNNGVVLGVINPAGGSTRVFRFNTSDPVAGWSEVTAIAKPVYNILYDVGRDRFVSFAARELHSSTDGMSWQREVTDLNLNPRAMIAAPDVFVTAGATPQGDRVFYSSSDGLSWNGLIDPGDSEGRLPIRAYASGYIPASN